MSHQRYPSHDAVKEPHSVSLKVLRLSRPSLVTQFPLPSPLSLSLSPTSGKPKPQPPPISASLAYSPPDGLGDGRGGIILSGADDGNPNPNLDIDINPDPFVLSPIVNLPPSFGSAYVGETFSCTLCASHDALLGDAGIPAAVGKTIRDVRIKAEMKTPGSAAVTRLELGPGPGPGHGPGSGDDDEGVGSKGVEAGAGLGVDLGPGATMQRIVSFDLKEEGNHVLAVTVSYYEATDVSGRTRTFRKLYQFICKASLIVRTKPGPLPAGRSGKEGGLLLRRWVLEAQLENCGEDVMQLEKVVLDLEPGLVYTDCNWEVGGGQKPVLHPGEVEQVCFVVEEVRSGDGDGDGGGGPKEEDGKVVFGVLGVGWRGEMGNRGFLSTGRLGTRHVKPVVVQKAAS